MNYSRKFNDQLNEEVNYDEYNRNNELVNNIRFNNRYSVDDYNDTMQTNNINTNINPNISYNNNNQSQNFNNQNNNQMDNNMNNNMISRNFNNNNMNNSMNGNINNNMNNNYNNNMNDNNMVNNNMNNNMNNNNFNNNFNTINGNMNNNNLNLSQNLNNNNNNNNMMRSQDINVDLNEYVRTGLESRGLHVGRTQSPRSIKLAEMERKKSLLNNIQTQINLTKRTKLEELKKRQEEDAQYLKDMVVCYPFGRGGGGAPNRDKSGNVIANRRNLISDPKYNFASINIDDDYNEVWGREKRIGRFYKNSSDIQNNNNINNIQNDNNINYSETIPSTPLNNNNYVNNDFYNQQPIINNRPFSTIPRQNMIPRNYNTISNDLLYKMKEEENKRLLEQKQRELEQEKENERILKEMEEIDREKNEIRLRKSLDEQNRLLQQYRNLNNNNDINNNENDETTIETNNIYRTNIINRDIIDPDSVILDKYAIEKINKSEMESRNRLNNEISRLRDQMHNQQLLLFQQISNLRNEAEKANNQREEALKEIEKLKAQLYKNNTDDLKKRYVHHLIITDDGNKNSDMCTQTDLPPKKDEDPLELNKLLKKNIDRLNYLEEIERLNALRRSPPSNHEYEYPKPIPEKEEEDDDLYEIEITKIHN